MGRAREKHRPLLSGIGVKSSAHDSHGTLTGLATRYDAGHLPARLISYT